MGLVLWAWAQHTTAAPPDPEAIDQAISALVTQFNDGVATNYPRFRHVLFGDLFETEADDAAAFFSIEGFRGSNDYAVYLALFASVDRMEEQGRTSRPYRLVAVSKIAGKMWRSYDWHTAVIEPNAVTVSGKKSVGGLPNIPIISTFREKNGQLTETTEEVVGRGRDDLDYFAKPARWWIRPLEEKILAWIREQRPELDDQIDHLRSDTYRCSDFWFVIGYDALPDHLALDGLNDDLIGPEIQSPRLERGSSRIYVRDGKISGIMIMGIGIAGGFPEDLGAFNLGPEKAPFGTDPEILFCLAAEQYEATNYPGAFATMSDAAASGNAQAQYCLGTMYAEGKGTPRHPLKAFRWYVKAAGQGIPEASYNLGCMLYKGFAVPQDYGHARTLFSKAADQGMTDARFNLSVMDGVNRGASIAPPMSFAPRLEDAATRLPSTQSEIRNSCTATVAAASVCADSHFRAQDYEGPPIMHQETVHDGHGRLRSIPHLGSRLLVGEDLPRDYDMALSLVARSARHGDPIAQYNLGLIYSKSSGALRDYEKAFLWFMNAAEQGHADARLNVGWMLSHGVGAPLDREYGPDWWTETSAQGNPETQATPPRTVD